jgi:outer membrane protein assembly factor BamB
VSDSPPGQIGSIPFQNGVDKLQSNFLFFVKIKMVSINRDSSNRASSWILILALYTSIVLCYANHQTVTVDEQGNAYILSQELEVSDEYDINHEPTLSNEYYYDDGIRIDEDDQGQYFQNSNANAFHSQGKSLNSIIVVTTVDGSIAGLSRDTGKVLWKQSGFSSSKQSDLSKPMDIHGTQHVNDSFRVRSPLVSTTTTVRSSRYDARTAAVPSVDGQVFLTDGADLTATSTIAELVARAPFLDSRGRFYVGSRSALAIALNRDTGDIVRLVDSNSDIKENSNVPDSSDARATTMTSTLLPNIHEDQTNGNENLICSKWRNGCQIF